VPGRILRRGAGWLRQRRDAAETDYQPAERNRLALHQTADFRFRFQLGSISWGTSADAIETLEDDAAQGWTLGCSTPNQLTMVHN